MTPEQTHARAREVVGELSKVIVGKRDALELVLMGVLAGGHVLLEDLPGMGKTLLARTFANVFGLSFTRVQFTPDLLPQDLTGAAIYNQKTGEFSFREGPVFTQFLLADEINRTPPKTQAALLEAMEERQVSSDGVTRPLPGPFVVLATENPIEYEGTYPLPEAQLDRFVLRTKLGYLDAGLEAEMVRRRIGRGGVAPTVDQTSSAAELLDMMGSLEAVEVHDDLLAYIVALVQATRHHPKAQVGASPRGTLAVTQLARAAAVLAGRDYITPEDVQRVAAPALGHRIVLRPELWVRRVSGSDVIAEVLEDVATPATRPQSQPQQQHQQAVTGVS
ncbi:MoxR family ATPase [Flindersiella endophytica]